MNDIDNYDKGFLKEIYNTVIDSFYKSGHLTEHDIKSKEALTEKLLNLKEKGILFKIAINHKDPILNMARELKDQGQYDYAKMFYALFFEHSINDIINTECFKRKITTKSKNDVLRHVNLHGKFGWLRELLELPVFNDKHYKIIMKVADERNAFIHYKFPTLPDYPEEIINKNKTTVSEFSAIEKSVKYMKFYETKINFKGNKASLEKVK